MNFLTCGLLSLCLGCSIAVSPASLSDDSELLGTAESMEPLSTDSVDQTQLFTVMQVGLTCPGDGLVGGSARNVFTLFSTTVTTYVYLYSSYFETDDWSQMTFEASAYIYDLDQGEILTATATTNGETKYWLAYAKYRCNNDDWQYVQSDPVLFDGDGNPI